MLPARLARIGTVGIGTETGIGVARDVPAGTGRGGGGARSRYKLMTVGKRRGVYNN